jgi:hypothetical protein
MNKGQVTKRDDGKTAGLPRKGMALAKSLGWLSLGMGAAELLAASTVAKTLGAKNRTDVTKAYGVREIATGIGILASADPTPWIWARVGGDALDLGTLAADLQGDNPKSHNVKLAMASIAGIMAIDLACAYRLSSTRTLQDGFLESYGLRSGMPKPPEQMRGLARDFRVPEDMRVPEALRPFAVS